MKHDFKTYSILLVIFLLSISSSLLIPTKTVLNAVIAAPGVMALLTALFQLIRDQASHERDKEMQQKQFEFSLGAASHMANTAFNKHVEFCEKYIGEVHKIMHILFRDMDTDLILKNAGNLVRLREDDALWLSDEIDTNLGKFEQAIRELGATARFIEKTIQVEKDSEKRSIKIEKNLKLLEEILGFNKGMEISEDLAIESIKKKLRSFLGVEELTGLRIHALKEACNVLARIT